MRRRTIAKVLLTVALASAPTTALAQRRNRNRNTQRQTQPSGGSSNEDSGAMTFTPEDAAQNAGDGASSQSGNTGSGEGDSGGLGGLEGVGGPEVRAMARPLNERIFAVQQIYALRNRRFELQPSVAISLNDPFVSHTGIGLAANYWITNVLAAGANFLFNQPFNGRADVDLRSARSIGLVVPINEYQLLAQANFTYVPVYGKFLMFNRFIFHYDFYLMAGVGITRTRPISVVDPEVRVNFDWQTAILFNAGIGVRVFLNRWLGIIAELRNYIYPERLESLTIGRPGEPGSRYDPSTWLGQSALTDNVMVHVGLTMLFPFNPTFRLQK